MRAIANFLAAVLLLSFGIGPGHAEGRFALVVGNDRYPNLPPSEQLERAVNDSRAVAQAAGKLGFEVIRGENLDRQGFIHKLDELTRSMQPGDIALFFFAGHGVSIGGGNYLLPTDVPQAQSG